MPLKPRRRTQSDSAANADKGSDAAESDEDASGRRVCESQGVPDAAGGKGSSRKYAWAVGLVVVAAIALVLLAFITGVITGGESDVSHDRSDAKLERRVQELTAALDGAFENDEAGVLPRSVEAGMQIVREIVHETLKRRERQLQKQEAEAAQDSTRNEGRGTDAVADPCPWGQRAADARKKLLGSSAWVRHMCLAEDGRSDPKGIQVRAFRGLPGVAYLQAGAMSPFTWVFAKVIDHLLANGYTANVNLMACPYDWRLALRWQEEVRKRSLFPPFYTKMIIFTKTGSGQT